MTTTMDLDYWMRYKKNFVGVFPRDFIPRFDKNFNGCLIANSHTSNLPGEHWIGIVCKNGVVYYYDPIGWIPCNSIIEKFNNFKKIHVNTVRYQGLNSKTCGHHVVYYLYTCKPAINDNYVTFFINNVLK